RSATASFALVDETLAPDGRPEKILNIRRRHLVLGVEESTSGNVQSRTRSPGCRYYYPDMGCGGAVGGNLALDPRAARSGSLYCVQHARGDGTVPGRPPSAAPVGGQRVDGQGPPVAHIENQRRNGHSVYSCEGPRRAGFARGDPVARRRY